jgi:hypothetical protein
LFSNRTIFGEFISQEEEIARACHQVVYRPLDYHFRPERKIGGTLQRVGWACQCIRAHQGEVRRDSENGTVLHACVRECLFAVDLAVIEYEMVIDIPANVVGGRQAQRGGQCRNQLADLHVDPNPHLSFLVPVGPRD